VETRRAAGPRGTDSKPPRPRSGERSYVTSLKCYVFAFFVFVAESFQTVDNCLPVTTATEIRQLTLELTALGRRVGLVPTMGALHDGHLSLVRASRAVCDETIVTIFVNPTQFGPREDFRTYPRGLDDDLAVLTRMGVRHVFVPAPEVIYPPGFSCHVEPPAVACRWEGECRPGHFRGVATVVLKIFNLIPAHVAFFGEKDYQQCLVIRQMVADLNLPMTLHFVPTVREQDGLALSSRNRYLSSEEREQARALPDSLALVSRMFGDGERDAIRLANSARDLLAAAGVNQLDYVAVTDPVTLEPIEVIGDKAVVLIAARFGKTRLLDNKKLSAVSY
jgi:pantoate--beta-alanine ligase